MKKAFVMKVYEQYYDEYEKRHDELWPELEQAIYEHSAISYSIFLLKETGQLFGYLELANDQSWEALAKTDICQKWWAYMAPIMETNPDNSPISTDLTCVFSIERKAEYDNI